jgi:hypothetical protein
MQKSSRSTRELLTPLTTASATRFLKNKIKSSETKEKLSWVEFAKKCQIRSGRELIPFTPYDWQEQFLEQIEKHSGIVLCKSRQLGATEFIGNWLLWQASNDPGFVAVVFSKTQSDSSDIAKRVRDMIVTYPDLAFETNNQKDLKLLNGGRIIFKPSTPNAARGIPSVAVVVFDECAFVEGVETIYASAQPATSMLGDKAKTILMSTPNGQQGFYWEMLREGNESEEILNICRGIRTGELPPVQYWTDNHWCKFFVHWKSHPVYASDENYLQKVKDRQKLTDAQLQREYDLNFEEAVNALYPQELVLRGARGVFQNAMQGRKYIAGIDPAFGGSDYFCLTIWDVSFNPYQLVRMYRENNKSKDYNLVNTVQILSQYRPSVVGVESNSGGRLILEDLINKMPWCKIEAVNTTESSKIVATDRLLLLLERDQMIYPDCELKSELLNFRESINGTRRKREAIAGHDDTVMSSAIAFSVFSIPFFDAGIGTVRY